MIPGYGISVGTIGFFITNTIDYELYQIYLLYIVLTTIFLVLGQICAKKKYLGIEVNDDFEKPMELILIAIFVYAIAYFIWLPYNPLKEFLLSGNRLQAIEYRIRITHGLSKMSVPFIFRYWRTVLQFYSAVIIFYIVVRKKYPFIVRMILIAVQIYFMIFTLEKAMIVYFFLAFILFYIIQNNYLIDKRKKKNMRLIVLLVFITSGVLVIVNSIFMDVSNPIHYIIDRLSRQTAATRFIIEYVRANGFVGLRGLDMPIIKQIFKYDYINLSKRAMMEIFPSGNTEEFAGSASDLSLAELYFMFGHYSYLIYSIFIFFIGYFDRLILNSINNILREEKKSFILAFYCLFSTSYMLTITTSVFAIYSFPLILNPGLYLILVFMFIFLRIKIKVN